MLSSKSVNAAELAHVFTEAEQSKQSTVHDCYQHDQSASPILNKKRKNDARGEEQNNTSKKLQIEDTECEKMPDQRNAADKSQGEAEECQMEFVENEDLSQFLKEYGISDTAQHLDVCTVLAMFHKLKSEWSANTKEEQLEKLRLQVSENVKKQINEAMTAYEEKITRLEQNLRAADRKTQLMSDILQYNEVVMQDITKRLDSLELANARRMAILTGVSLVGTKKQDRIRELTNFFRTELEVYSRVEDTYKLGAAENSPIVICFQSYEDKEAAFAVKNKLKDLTKDQERNIYLNHYLPAQENEKRKRERKIIADLKKSEENQKPEAEYTKGGLKVGTSLYKKQVTVPKATDLLDMTTEELDEIMKVKTLKGPVVRVKDSTFMPYGVDVKNHEMIRKAYQKIKMIHVKAKHVVCVYMLPGADAQKHENCDSCDDGETGVGASLLREMENNNIFNKAIMIARYSGTEKLDENRHDAYIKAAKELQKQKPINAILDLKQTFQDEPSKRKNQTSGYKYRETGRQKRVNQEKHAKENTRSPPPRK